MKKIKTFASKLFLFLSTDWFLLAIIGFFAIQAIWLSFSFRFPMLFDEKFHFEAITFLNKNPGLFYFSNGSQNPNYDYLGSVAFGGITAFHYILSFILRLARLITSNFTLTIIGFRIINIAMVAIGILFFSRLFRKLKINSIYINLGLLLYVLLPMTIFVSATINYDNMLFMLTPIFLLLGVKILQLKAFEAKSVILFLIIGVFASLVKPAFLPIFFIGVAMLLINKRANLTKEHGLKVIGQINESNKFVSIFLLFILAILCILFFQRYIFTTFRYSSPLPDCAKILNYERCQSNEVYKLESMVIATKNERPVVSLAQYVSGWYSKMFFGYGITASVTSDGKLEAYNSPKILNDAIFIIVSVFILAIIYQYKENTKNNSFNFVLYCVLALVLTTIYFNASSYFRAHSELNLNPRYVLYVLPIIFVFGIRDLSISIGNHPVIKSLIIISALIVFTQGGGLSTHILNSNERWYWPDTRVLYINNKAKEFLNIIVK